MRSVTNKPIMLSVVMLNVVMLSVVAPSRVDLLIKMAYFVKKILNKSS